MDVHFMFFDHPSSFPMQERWEHHTNRLIPVNHRDKITVISSAFNDLHGRNADFDCIVSPANSYGIMDGGIDMVFSRTFSGGSDDPRPLALTHAVQDVLAARYFGFAPPTTCTIVPIPPTLHNGQFPRCKFLAVSPTMRVPSNVSWHEDLVYNTMWTLLVEIEKWNSHAKTIGSGDVIKQVALSGFATGTGMVPKDVAARQMILALSHFLERTSNLGQQKLSDRQWTSNWDNIVLDAVNVVDE